MRTEAKFTWIMSSAAYLRLFIKGNANENRSQVYLLQKKDRLIIRGYLETASKNK